MKAREIGRAVVITESIAAATIVDFVIGNATSRVGWWGLGGEVDWRGFRRRVRQRAVSSVRLSVSLGCVQVDDFVFVGCHCCGCWFGCVVDNFTSKLSRYNSRLLPSTIDYYLLLVIILRRLP